jgi:hypothetical protein
MKTYFLFAMLVSGIAMAQDNWPRLSVAYYDCYSSKAGTADTSQRNAINSASKLIYTNILNNVSNEEIFFFSYGFTDTTAADMASSGTSFCLPDTGRPPFAKYDFVIASSITGNPGSYTLTVSILDGTSYSHVADGIAEFSTATVENVSVASLSAVQQILPLTTRMRNFQKALKTVNALLTINPMISVSPAELNLPLNGSTSVTITATDCDGQPIANRQLMLQATRGSFSSPTVQTDAIGSATATFNAENAEGISILTATIENAISVTQDTTSPDGSNSVVIGNIDTLNLWVLEFDMARSYSGYSDELKKESDGTRWAQKSVFWTQRSYGKFIGPSNNEKNTEFSFSDSTLSVSGVYFKHTFSKETFTDETGNACPKVTWSMGGSSESWMAKTIKGGDAGFDYSPGGISLFALQVPFENVSVYGYDWRIAGRWENGNCKTEMLHQGVPYKVVYTFAGGIAYYGADPVPGLSIFPMLSGETVTGYSIYVNSASTGYASDGSFYYAKDQCTATNRTAERIIIVAELSQSVQSGNDDFILASIQIMYLFESI